jgi:hypothetical protein
MIMRILQWRPEAFQPQRPAQAPLHRRVVQHLAIDACGLAALQLGQKLFTRPARKLTLARVDGMINPITAARLPKEQAARPSRQRATQR